MDLKRLTEFVQLTHRFQAVTRAIDIPGGMRPENDLEHTCQLALTAWYLNDKDNLGLDPYRVIALSLAHDLVETHAGDTYTYDTRDKLDSKAERERHAAEQLTHDWPDFPHMSELITEYEAGETAEAKFVYALDKLLPMMNNYTDDGRSWRQKGIGLADVRQAKTGKADRSPAVAPYFSALMAELERSPQLFPPASATPATAPITEAEWDRHYLARARQLAAQSDDRVGCGAVIVRDGRVLAETTNSQRADRQAVFHAEVKAIMTSNQVANDRTLRGAVAYCSCEPCAMCLAALSYAKVDRIVYDQRMADLVPDRPQSGFDAQAFVQTLDFVPTLEHLPLAQPKH